MKYKIKFMPDTRDDLKLIKEYQSQFYPNTPKKFFALLRKRIGQLKEFSYSCPVYEDDENYRKLIVGNYLVFYIVNESNKSVDVYAVFHGSRDIKQHLSPITEK